MLVSAGLRVRCQKMHITAQPTLNGYMPSRHRECFLRIRTDRSVPRRPLYGTKNLTIQADIHGMTAIVEPILPPRADICNPGPSSWGSRDIENGDAGAGCGRSSAISRRISANRPPWHRALGQPGQLDWNVTYRPCVTIPATILIGVSFRPVGDHRLTASGRLGVRMKLPGLQASA